MMITLTCYVIMITLICHEMITLAYYVKMITPTCYVIMITLLQWPSM